MILNNDLSETISLDGLWDFMLGPAGEWSHIQVPGCWEAQNHDMFTDGPARYRREITLPAHWAGCRVLLEFEAVSYACEVFCNGARVGSHIGMWTPFAVDLTAAARPGQPDQVELVIYKPGGRYPTRACLAGFLPDVATTFGGPWQSIRLRALRAGLRDVRIWADYGARSIHAAATLERHDPALPIPTWRVQVTHGDAVVACCETAPGEAVDVTLTPEEVHLWEPERPELYTVTVDCLVEGQPIARAHQRVGFRRLSARGEQLLLNDRPLMVRGVLSWGWDPTVIAPCYTPETARAEMRRARAMGFNLIKLCLFVPNQAYFDAADEEGMLLWQELPMWLPSVTPELRARAPQEYDEITAQVAPHPAVVLYSLGCELNQSVDAQLLDQLNRVVRARARDILLCDNSGSGESYGGLDFDFSDFTDYHPYYDLHYFIPLLDAWRRDWQPERPWIFGEFCDSDTFRDQDELTLVNGGERPWWLTPRNPVTTWRPEAQAAVEWHERLRQADPGFTPAEMAAVSHRQSFVIRKYILEALRRRRGMGGYIITGLRDTPISTSGVWDDLLRPKWPEQDFLQINGEAILCLDVSRRRRWQHGGDRPDPLDPYAWWAGAPLRWDVILHSARQDAPPGGRLAWSITTWQGQQVAGDSTRVAAPAQAGIPIHVGVIRWQAPERPSAQGYTLTVSYQSGSVSAENRWTVWVYPRPGALPPDLTVYDPSGLLADSGDRLAACPRLLPWEQPDPARPLLATALPATLSLHGGLWEYLAQGGRVLLLQWGDAPLPARRCPFWREAIRLFAAHPLWERFPHQGFTDLQFFGLASDLAFHTPQLLAALPPGAAFRPILRRLDAREFHLSDDLFEITLGAGRLFGCALRLTGGAGAQAAGWNRNVAGAALFDALLQTLTGDVL